MQVFGIDGSCLRADWRVSCCQQLFLPWTGRQEGSSPWADFCLQKTQISLSVSPLGPVCSSHLSTRASKPAALLQVIFYFFLQLARSKNLSFFTDVCRACARMPACPRWCCCAEHRTLTSVIVGRLTQMKVYRAGAVPSVCSAEDHFSHILAAMPTQCKLSVTLSKNHSSAVRVPAHSWDIPAHGRAHGHTVFHSAPVVITRTQQVVF